MPVGSGSWSLSDRLCLRFPGADRSDGSAVVVGGSCCEVVVGAVGGPGRVWWAEDGGEGEAWEVGMDGSAEAIGGGVGMSLLLARTSACLHVPAVDAGIGRSGAVPEKGFLCRTMRGPSEGWTGHEAAAGFGGQLAAFVEGVQRYSVRQGGGDGRRDGVRRDDVGGRSVRRGVNASSGVAPRRAGASGEECLRCISCCVGVGGGSLRGRAARRRQTHASTRASKHEVGQSASPHGGYDSAAAGCGVAEIAVDCCVGAVQVQ